MLWEGEEFAENYDVAGGGALRISFLRGDTSDRYVRRVCTAIGVSLA